MPGPPYTWDSWTCTADQLTAALTAAQSAGWEIFAVVTSPRGGRRASRFIVIGRKLQ